MDLKKVLFYFDHAVAPVITGAIVCYHGSRYGISAASLLMLALGAASWTFLEYWIHRAAHKMKGLREEHFHHHAHPNDITGPTSFTTVFIYLGIWLFLSGFSMWFASSFFPGLLGGYAVYLHIHNAIHRFKKLPKWFQWWKRYHEAHHKGKRGHYGVTTSLWDRVFGPKK